MQNTKDSRQLELLLVVHRDIQDSILGRLRESASYVTWSESINASLESPRSSKRFENLL
jgi:hypothetical protein